MTREVRKTSQLTQALLETAEDMRVSGVLNASAFDKITLRHITSDATPTAEPIAGDEIRALRERARMSQAVFARHLNLTAGYLSQLERGAKHATGPALVLLNVIRRKGFEAIL
jgi:putative transcriptional regulator